MKFAPIDFTKDKLDVVLHKAGFRNDLQTFVIWEGVTYYVPEDGVRSTLQVLSKMAPGSQIAVDFMNKTFVFGDAANPRANPGFPQWGEPWVFGIPDNTEDQFFGQYGYSIGKKASVTGNDPDVAKMYLTRHDGSIYGGPVPTRGGWWVGRTHAREALSRSDVRSPAVNKYRCVRKRPNASDRSERRQLRNTGPSASTRPHRS